MAVYINTLIGGDITIGSSGGGASGHAETRFTLEGGTVETHNITGTLDRQWMIANGYYNENETTWLKTITQADIGNTVTSIGTEAFQSCSDLTSVTIPNSVTSIGIQAFCGCSSLTSVTIPSTVTTIGDNAFDACYGLPIVIPNGVTTIGNSAFCGNYATTSLIIPSSVNSIGSDAFVSMYGLTSMTFSGKTLAQVQEMNNYPWGLEDTSIINVA